MKANFQIYIKNSVEAVAFYQRAFDLTLGMNYLKEDGMYGHCSLMYGDDEIFCIAEDRDNGLSTVTMSENINIHMINMGTKEAVDRAYAVLNENAIKPSLDVPGPPDWDEDKSDKYYSFGVTDKYGVQWWVVR